MSCSAWPWYIIWKVKKTLSTLCLLVWGFCAKPVFCANIFSGDLSFDTLIVELFYMCLIISQTLGEDNFKRCLLVCQVRVRELVWTGAKRKVCMMPFTLLSYLWDLEERRCDDLVKSSFGLEATREGSSFYGG